MVAEVFERDYARIGNQLLRDARISYRAKGIFCWLASHREGFGVSPESIAAAGAEGISAVKSALRELEQYGYLTRSQIRTAGGTMGNFTYRITDMPSSEPLDGNRPPVPISKDAENRRSEPVDGKPPADEPPAVNRPHKKTIPSKKISSEEKTTSSPAEPAEPEPAVEPDVTDGGGGGVSDLRSIAEHITASLDYQDQVPDKQQLQALTAALVAVLEKGWTIQVLAPYLRLGSYRPGNPVAFYLAKLTKNLPDTVPTPPAAAARGGVRGPMPTAEDYAGTTLDSLFGLAPQSLAGVGAQGGTDGTVAAWMDLSRNLAKQGHQPYSNDSWTAPADPFAAASIPWCGELECDEKSRMRDGVDHNGLPFVYQCEKCHPAQQF